MKIAMIWQKLKITDWQRVADWCGRFFWKYLLLAMILWPVFIICIVSFEPWDETLHQAVLAFTSMIIIWFELACIALGLVGIIISFFLYDSV